jgi:GNAT superfamily N-acetyltransferase
MRRETHLALEDITLNSFPTAEDLLLIEGGLSEFNKSRFPPEIPLGIFLEQRGRISGGLLATLGLGVLWITDIWLEPELRGRRLGSRLIATAEQYAMARGCRAACVGAFDIQAPQFFRRCGYQMLFSRPVGAHRHEFLQRILEPGEMVECDGGDATIRAQERPEDDDVTRVRHGLRLSRHQISIPTSKPLTICASRNGSSVGGIIGQARGESFFVSVLWVDAPNRGQGIGRRLITGAEQKALEHGCRFSFLDTFSFQAPGFYFLLGYETIGLVECGMGLQRLYLRKNLCGNTRDKPAHGTD